jgi:hypothetical protein
MAVAESLVERVVAEVSSRMAEPSYAQVAIGSFVQSFPDVSRFLTAQGDELGGGEGVIHAVFHAEIVAECFRRSVKKPLADVGFRELDAASTADPVAELGKLEPAIASFVVSNIDGDAMRRVLAHIALALQRAARP